MLFHGCDGEQCPVGREGDGVDSGCLLELMLQAPEESHTRSVPLKVPPASNSPSKACPDTKPDP
jgi:hypothetical protein